MSKNLLVFWDSIARWAYDREQWGRVERLKLWGFAQDDLFVYNYGVSANSTTELLQRCDKECQIKAPFGIIFAIGINDAQYQMKWGVKVYRTESLQFAENLQWLVTMAQKYTTNIVFVWLTSVVESQTLPRNNFFYANQDIANYNKIIQEVASQNDKVFIDLSSLLEDADLHDGLHPNAWWHKKIYTKILWKLQKHHFFDF